MEKTKSLHQHQILSTPMEENYENFDLSKNLLPFVAIDYLSYTPSVYGGAGAQAFIKSEFEKLKPDLRSLDLFRERQKEGKTEEMQEFITDYYSTTVESKYQQMKYDVIFDYYIKNNYSKQYIRIPGELSHLVVDALVRKDLQFNQLISNITRIDFKMKIPEFKFTNLEQDIHLLETFHEVQRLDRFKSELHRGFAIGYIGSRTSRRMVRTYVSEKRETRTWELECKRESAAAYSEFLQAGDIAGFNRTLILELIESFSHIKDCGYTRPLLEWNQNFLHRLKMEHFPNHTFYKRKKPREGSLEPVREKKEVNLRDVLTKGNYAINTNMINSLGVSNNKECLNFMILLYCSKLLLKKWKTEEKPSSEIKTLLHKTTWDDVEIREEGFVSRLDYRVDFVIKDVLEFLNLSNTSNNRNKVVSILEELMDLKLEFQVENHHYRQQFVYSLCVTTSRGLASRASLVLHPFIVYSLLDYALIFHEKFLKDYLNLLEKHKVNPDKRSLSFGFYAFYSVFLSLSLQKQDYFKRFLLRRSKTNLQSRQRQIEFIKEFIPLASNYLNVDLGVKLDSIKEIPASYQILESILNRKDDRVLNRSEFFFQPRPKTTTLTPELLF